MAVSTGGHGRGGSMMQQLQPGDPRKVGPYWLLGRLGGGGMGQVFLGRSPGERLVAVKVVRAELAEQAEFRARFAHEVAAARTVSGLFTAPVIDADLDALVPWLATAYIPGLSLADTITRYGPLPARSVRTLAAGLAEGLGAIHAAGIVHRDLKPSNVLLAEDGPRVIDFGISQAAEATMLTAAGLVVGSPGFMSPEQAQGRRVGPPSDVFSLGAVLTFAATGQGPFGSGSSVSLLYRVVSQPPDTSGVPAELRPLVERCLAKDPEQRPGTGQLLAELNTVPPATGWLPEPITQAFPVLSAAESRPAAPTAADYPQAAPATQLAATATADVPVRAPPTVTAGAIPPPPTVAGPTGRGGGAEGRPGRFRLGLLSAIVAVILAAAYLILATTAHLPPFSKPSLAPSSPAPAPTAPTSPGPRPSPAVTSPAPTGATSPATSGPSSPVTSPATSGPSSPVTSPATSGPSSPVTSPAVSGPASPVTSPAVSGPSSPGKSSATSGAASPAASPAGSGAPSAAGASPPGSPVTAPAPSASPSARLGQRRSAIA